MQLRKAQRKYPKKKKDPFPFKMADATVCSDPAGESQREIAFPSMALILTKALG